MRCKPVAYLAIAPHNDRLDASKYLSWGKPVVQPVKSENLDCIEHRTVIA